MSREKETTNKTQVETKFSKRPFISISAIFNKYQVETKWLFWTTNLKHASNTILLVKVPFELMLPTTQQRIYFTMINEWINVNKQTAKRHFQHDLHWLYIPVGAYSI